MRRPQGLTVRQRKFLSGIAEGMDQTAAANAAGYAHPTVAGSKLMKSSTISRAIGDALEEQGLDNQFLVRKMSEFCNAVRQDEAGAIPDYPVQMRGVDMICRLKGLYKADVQVEKKMTFEDRVHLIQEIKENPKAHIEAIIKVLEIRGSLRRGNDPLDPDGVPEQ